MRSSNATLTGQVTGAAEWHINADEPDILDYDTSFKPPAQEALYEPNQYRTSDHDAVVVGLELNAPPTFQFVAGGSVLDHGQRRLVPRQRQRPADPGGLALVEPDRQHQYDPRPERERLDHRGRHADRRDQRGDEPEPAPAR